jgi:16S rRNA G966 N2-methylase RsmD
MLRIERAEALSWMARATPESYELVLLDPPFDAGLAVEAVAVAAPLLAAGGYLYLESGQPGAEPPAGLMRFRHLDAGAVHAELWRRAG